MKNRKYYKKQRKPRRRAPHVENLVTATLQQSAQRSTLNTEAYRNKSIKLHLPQSKHKKQHRHNAPHPTPKHTETSQHRSTSPQPRTLQKSPRGVQRGRGFTAPLRFSAASQSKKTRPSAKKVKIKPKTNHTINKEK